VAAPVPVVPAAPASPMPESQASSPPAALDVPSLMSFDPKQAGAGASSPEPEPEPEPAPAPELGPEHF